MELLNTTDRHVQYLTTKYRITEHKDKNVQWLTTKYRIT
jgi:hypothetical protein